jgi:hypothetical protein
MKKVFFKVFFQTFQANVLPPGRFESAIIAAIRLARNVKQNLIQFRLYKRQFYGLLEN